VKTSPADDFDDLAYNAPFLLAGGNPNWVPRQPMLPSPPPSKRRPGRPREELAGIAVQLPNGSTCIAIERLIHDRWQCQTDHGPKIFSGGFLRALKRSQGR
jgi:hypothetical protein